MSEEPKKRDDLYLKEILSRSLRIESYVEDLDYDDFLESNLHKSAVIRELEVIGEASKFVSDITKKLFPDIPWAQMAGLRNRLIHGYFDVDHSIVWEVAQKQIPSLRNSIEKVILQIAPALHPWRPCPSGYYFVSSHKRRIRSAPGVTTVREHCRRNPTGKEQLYPGEISAITGGATGDLPEISAFPSQSDFAKSGSRFDREIQVWTRYWNDIFSPKEPLSPDIVKALVASESSFRLNLKPVRLRKGNSARGPFQITDQTRKILADENGELKDHYLTLTSKDVEDPAIGAAAAIRWLFHKKDLASSYLGREATWIEAVGDYKAYLRKKGPLEKHEGMANFLRILADLRRGSL